VTVVDEIVQKLKEKYMNMGANEPTSMNIACAFKDTVVNCSGFMDFLEILYRDSPVATSVIKSNLKGRNWSLAMDYIDRYDRVLFTREKDICQITDLGKRLHEFLKTP
jgi:hypothetical protein